MKKKNICITEFDKIRLEGLITMATAFSGHNRKNLEFLAAELEDAEIVTSKEVPPDVVTMNSKIEFRDLVSSEKMIYVLVFPKDADIDAGAISVLAPVGTAILGYAKGDVVEWSMPSGIRRIVIEEILYQPEASGDFHL